MASNRDSIAFLVAARESGVSFEDTLMLGRQFFLPDEHALRMGFADAGLRIDLDEARQLFDGGWSEAFVRHLGARQVDSLDASKYEDAASSTTSIGRSPMSSEAATPRSSMAGGWSRVQLPHRPSQRSRRRACWWSLPCLDTEVVTLLHRPPRSDSGFSPRHRLGRPPTTAFHGSASWRSGAREPLGVPARTN
jgi:hypothetical protein